MADNIVGGLFGMTPELLQAQRNAQLEQQAANFVNNYGDQGAMFGYKLGNVLGRGIGGMLGAQDPEMMRIQQRQQMLQGLDMNDPQSLMKAAQAANQAGDTSAAQELYNKAQQVAQARATLGKTEAETQKALRERAGADPLEQLLRTGKYTPESVSKYAQTGDPSVLVPVENMNTQVVETKDGQILIDKRTGQRIANLGPSPERGTKISTEIKQPPDIASAIGAFDTLVKPYRETYNSSETAQQLLNEAVKANNSQAFEAARTTIAKAVGENKLSNEDIKRTGIDPRLVQGALDWVNKKVVGVPNEDIIKQMYAVSTALRNKAAQRINEQADRAQEAARSSEFKGDLQLYFPKVKAGSIASSGGFDADKEARYQAWKNKQGL